jgi:hypothetical protein
MHNCIIGGVGKARSSDGNNVATGYASLPEVGMRDTMPGKPKLFTTMVAESVAIYPPCMCTFGQSKRGDSDFTSTDHSGTLPPRPRR